jgi:hypothetical protein
MKIFNTKKCTPIKAITGFLAASYGHEFVLVLVVISVVEI